MSRILLFVALLIVVAVALPATAPQFQGLQRIVRAAAPEPARFKRGYGGYGGFGGGFGGGYGGFRKHGYHGYRHRGFGGGCRWGCGGGSYYPGFSISGAKAGSISTPFGSGSFAHSFSGGYGR